MSGSGAGSSTWAGWAGWAGRLGLFAASLAVVALVAEVGLRSTWRQPWWEQLRQEQTDEVLTVFEVGTMRLPLRSAPVAPPKERGEYRILFLGDSFTYGLGVDAADSFVGRIDALLNERRPKPGVTRYRVFNGGIPGSLTVAWSGLLFDFGEAFQPDLVVAVFFLRDGVAGVTTDHPIKQIRAAMQRLEETSWAYRRVHLVRWLYGRRALHSLSERYLGQLRDSYLGDEADHGEWWRARSELLRMRSRSRRLGADFSMVVFPMLFQLGDDYPLADVCAEIERFARERDMPVFSLLPTFRGMDGPELWISAFDQHPNEEAHRIAADALYPFVEQRIRAGDDPEVRNGDLVE